MRIEVAGIDGELYYRPLEPGDEAAVWRCCGQREPRPPYRACIDLVSDQLEADGHGGSYLAPAASAVARRLLAVYDDQAVALITAHWPAAITGTPALEIDPAGEDLAGDAARDGLVWLAQVGHAAAEVTIHWPPDRGIERFSASELPSRWGRAGRTLAFTGD